MIINMIVAYNKNSYVFIYLFIERVSRRSVQPLLQISNVPVSN